MTIKIGTDIVNIERVQGAYAKEPVRFIKRLLTPAEQRRFDEQAEKAKMGYLAKRFAGKEAVAKALGTGIGDAIRFNEIQILNDETGRPFVSLLNGKFPYIDQNKISISLSDDAPFAVAFVVISE